MLKLFSLFYNIVQLLGWSSVLGLVVLETLNETKQTATIVCLVQVLQVTQLWDLISNLMGITSGSLISNIMQLGGRILVALIFMYDGVCFSSLANALVAWSLAEIIRFSYYLFKNVSLFKVLRYNAFMILYPVGILGELRVINYYLQSHEELKTPLRTLQGILIVGGVFMFTQMLGAKLKSQKKTKQTDQRSSSPSSRAKRE